MTPDVPAAIPQTGELPAPWRDALQSQLHPAENVLAVLEVDLDARLHFVASLVVVTNRRLLCRASGDSQWQEWTYRDGLELRHHDHAGVGHLNLVDRNGLLATWRFTLSQNLYAIRLVDQFQSHLQSHLSGKPLAQALVNVCPSCKAPLAPDQDECPICTKVIHTPPSTWTLFRLWRFARVPRRG